MRKLLASFFLMFLAGCASDSVKESGGQAGSTDVITSEPPEASRLEEAKSAAAPEDVARPATPATPSQYSALNEAIKLQNDERIYQAATQILTQSPNDTRALNALAMYHYKKGRYTLSRFLLGKGIAASPKASELYSNLGIVQLAQNEQREAIKSFRRALELNSEDGVAAANLGAVYVKERDFTKANIVLETAYRRGIRDLKVLNNFAVALTAQRKFERAEEIYKMLVKDNPSKESLYNYATLLIDNMGKYSEGLEVINRLKFVGGPPETRNKIIALENKAKAGLN